MAKQPGEIIIIQLKFKISINHINIHIHIQDDQATRGNYNYIIIIQDQYDLSGWPSNQGKCQQLLTYCGNYVEVQLIQLTHFISTADPLVVITV